MKLIPKKYNLDSFNSGHFFEDLSDHESFYFKKFFRGLSIYMHGKLVVCLCDGPDDKSFRGKKYKIDIWDGCLIPTNREHHSALLKLIKGTMIHPVIEKWLYLPMKSEHFEDSMIQIAELIKRKNVLIGVEPNLKSKKPEAKKISNKRIKISQMMNLGPAVEKDFATIGIYYADEIIKLGAKKSFIKMLEGRLKIGRSASCCNALYLYSIHGAINNIHWTQIPDKLKEEFKAYTAQLRKSGKYKK
jgi:hypothetical protein